MLRLAASATPLWRSADTLQFGIRPDAATVSGVTAWQERLLDHLAGGIPDAMWRPLGTSLGANASELAAFRIAIEPALAPPPPPAWPVTVETPLDLDQRTRESLRSCLASMGTSPLITADPTILAARHDPVVLLAHRVIDPRRTIGLMREDIPHVPIALDHDRAEIGPLVVPGETAGLCCLYAQRTRDDGAWPIVAASTLGRPAPPAALSLVLEACTIAVKLIESRTTNLVVTITSGSLLPEATDVQPDATCLCRSL